MADGMADSGVQVAEKTDVGGVDGHEAMYVKMIASDGQEFIMKRSHALTSGTIKAMLSGPGKLVWSLILINAHYLRYNSSGQFAENETNVVNFKEIPWVKKKHPLSTWNALESFLLFTNWSTPWRGKGITL